MRLFKHLAAGLALLMATVMPAMAEFSLDDVMAAMADDVIRPAYGAFADTTAALQGAVQTLCSAPSKAAHDTANLAFADAVSAWSRAEMVREGPVMQDNRLERILFYPDRKGTGLKQVQAALAGQDTSVTDAVTLAGKSVAMQGFGALEYVLAGTDSELLDNPAGAFRCSYGQSIATNLHARAGELVSAWEEDGETDRLWNSHDASNPFFRSDREALNLVLGTLIHGLELVRDVRIGAFLDVKDGKDKPKSAIHWRSGNTMRVVTENLSALEAMFDKSGLDGALPDDQKFVADSIRFDFRVALEALREINKPIDVLLADKSARDKLVFVHATIGDLVKRFDQDFAIASGLAAGFSFADGD